MPLYNCECCNISTKIKTHYKRHLLTKKHLRKVEEIKPLNTNEHKMNTNEHKMNTNEHKMNIPISFFNCSHCEKIFKSLPSKRRHELHYCKQNIPIKNEELYSELLSIKEEKNRLYKQIEKLIDKAGDTNITNNSKNINIKLNSYGNENLSHITDDFKTKLLHGPYGMIPMMIEHVHFNPKFPENKNIALTNKKENHIKIFSGSKWIYKDKNDTINDLLDGKYFILDTHYENICDKINGKTKSIYEQFRQFFDEKDSELFEKLKKECELTLLNNR